MRNKAYWVEQLGEKWTLNLKDILRDPYMDKLMDFVTIEYAMNQIYPQYQEDVFNAFKMCPWDNVRVVILGEEPHFTSGYEVLAYSDKYIHAYHNGCLTKIRELIEKEYYGGFNLDFDYSLEQWADQGVLLLNRSLTVRANLVESHKKPWNKFFISVIQSIIDYKPGTIFMIWGKQFDDIIPLLKNQHVFCWEHPREALMEYRDWNCPNFKQVDKLIEHLNGSENKISW